MQKRRLGISLYPERSTFEQDVAYLEKAAKLGFDLLFIALLGAGDRQQTIDRYKPLLAKAKELLAQAGYPNGFDMTISVPSNYQPHMDTAEVVAEQLRAVGVNVTIQPMEWGVWYEQVYKGRDFQATLVGLDASAMTARALLERFTSDHAKNFVNYNNPDYDALFTQTMNASDDTQQTEIYKQMETMLSDTAANLYIQDLADLVAMRQNLAGLEFYPIYVLDLSTVHFVK